jgi:exo-beta-1,3-glucanase (GH17 family)
MKVDLIDFVYYKEFKKAKEQIYTHKEVENKFLSEFGMIHKFNYFQNNTVIDESKFTIFMMKYPHLISKVYES